MSFVDVFGGSPVQPSDVAYREITLTDDITLTWPSSLIDTDEILARIMNVTPDMAGHTITLPSASQVSVGADFLIYNVGASSFSLNDATGGNLIVIAPGESWYFWLTDNTTEAGTWSQIQFGTGTAAIVASALAGNGLTTIAGRLNTNYPYREINANYAVQLIDRAALIVWTGGTGTITLPSIADATRGFYVAINNQGTGLLSVVTADGALIDGEATFNLNIGNSSLFICTNPNWNSLGYGRNEVLPITALPPLNISGAGGLTVLTASQYQNTVLEFTGALVMNEVVEFPSIVSYWLITNSTTNAFTVTARLSNLNSVILPQGLSVLVYCDGTYLYIISGASTGNTVSSILGTADQIIASPSTGTVTLSLDTDVVIANSVQVADVLISDTGLLTLSPNQSYGLTTSGSGSVNLRNSTAGTAGMLRFYANNFTNSAGFTAGARTVDTTWRLPLTDSVGTQALVSDGAGNLSWSTGGGGIVTVNGTVGEIVANTVGDDVTLSLDDPVFVNNITVATNTRCGDLLLSAEDITSINPNGSVNIFSAGTGSVTIENLIYPNADGTNGQVLTTDGAGNLGWSDSNANTLSKIITQVAHGFTGGEWVYLNGATYTLAIATGAVTAEVVGVVSNVIDVNTFTLQYGGNLSGLVGLTAGSVYFLSDSVAGQATTVQPTTVGYVSKPLYIADTTTTAIMINESRGSVNTEVSNDDSIVQVISATKTDTFSMSGTAWTDVTGLSVNITPKSASSKVYISVNLSVGMFSATATLMTITRNGTPIYIGDAAGSRTSTGAFSYGSGDALLNSVSMMVVDSPATTAATTYTVQIRNIGASASYINRANDDADSAARYRGASSITCMEIF